jgi:hypothetical protein
VYFDWNLAKAAENFRKHEVSFEEAATVFYDSLGATGADPIILNTKKGWSLSACLRRAGCLWWLIPNAAQRTGS